MEQLCWKCTKACGKNMCSKFMYGKLPKGVKLNEENYIIYCPNFDRDFRNITITEKCNTLKIDRRKYAKNKELYDRLYIEAVSK